MVQSAADDRAENAAPAHDRYLPGRRPWRHTAGDLPGLPATLAPHRAAGAVRKAMEVAWPVRKDRTDMETLTL